MEKFLEKETFSQYGFGFPAVVTESNYWCSFCNNHFTEAPPKVYPAINIHDRCWEKFIDKGQIEIYPHGYNIFLLKVYEEINSHSGPCSEEEGCLYSTREIQTIMLLPSKDELVPTNELLVSCNINNSNNKRTTNYPNYCSQSEMGIKFDLANHEVRYTLIKYQKINLNGTKGEQVLTDLTPGKNQKIIVW